MVDGEKERPKPDKSGPYNNGELTEGKSKMPAFYFKFPVQGWQAGRIDLMLLAGAI